MDLNVIGITDCGSTTTKAILIEKIDGVYRQTYRGEAPTTVEAPVEDVTKGVLQSLYYLGKMSGRQFVDDQGQIIRPSIANGNGLDAYLSTSSAGGGLQMVTAGMVRRISAESAEHAALGAGAIVADVIACDDGKSFHTQIDRIRNIRPDIVLLAGGTDGGSQIGVVEMAQVFSAADPKPRFGQKYKLPIIYAGNCDAAAEVSRILGDKADLIVVDNVRPTVDSQQIEPAREKIHDLFLEHVMQQAPGYAKLMQWADAPIMPTPSAVGEMLLAVSKEKGQNCLCVDIGGATTDVFSVVNGQFHRTVSANLGVSYSASFVLAEVTAQKIHRWLPFDLSHSFITDQVMNKTVRPTTIPDTTEDLMLEQSLGREALRLSFERHQEFATGLKAKIQDKNVDGGFSKGEINQRLVTPDKLDLIIGSGGVLSHAPHVSQTISMLIDAFLPQGMTQIAKDSIFMMPHLGVLATVNKAAAHSVFEKDCVVNLCMCVAPSGKNGKLGSVCLIVKLNQGAKQVNHVVKWGELKAVVLPEQLAVSAVIQPARKVDIGFGKGKKWSGELTGNIVFDCRGRPIIWPKEECRLETIQTWQTELTQFDTMSKRPISADNKSCKANTHTAFSPNKTQGPNTAQGSLTVPKVLVSPKTLLTRKRDVPVGGKVLVQKGDLLTSEQAVASAHIPGTVHSLQIAQTLGVSRAKLKSCLLVREGETVQKGQVIAQTQGILGLMQSKVVSPAAGIVESVSVVSGQVLLREPAVPLLVKAFLNGRVNQLDGSDRVWLQTQGAIVQGIFGLGKETYGQLICVCDSAHELLDDAKISEVHHNKIVVGGGGVTLSALKKARKVGVAGLVVAAASGADLVALGGESLNMASSGDVDIGYVLMITEGFGKMSMAQKTFKLLRQLAGSKVSMSGKTQVRAGVIRPELIGPPLKEPLNTSNTATHIHTDEKKNAESPGLSTGSKVRIVRGSGFGATGVVADIPAQPMILNSGSKALVVKVLLENGEELQVPQANIEC